jgi:hypothetical protein
MGCAVDHAAAEQTTRTILPLLATLPVTIVPESGFPAREPTTYDVVAFNRVGAGARWLNIGNNVFHSNLASLITDDAYPGASAFHLEIVNRESSPNTKVRIVFEATATSCLASHIDNRLMHTFSAGREIRVSSAYYKDTTRLARATTGITLCTAFNGQLAVLLGAPAAEMLQATFITYDNNGAKAAVSEMNIDFPLNAW